ncbi:MAG: hypothetical protein AAFO07_07380 [Bacteroidota bacterium]
MHNTFISIVIVIHNPSQTANLNVFLSNAYQLVSQHFTDYEFILIKNYPGNDLLDEINMLEESIKKNIYLLNLASSTNINHAFLAGLDRANGDYTIIFELEFKDQPELILELFKKARTPYDIVYLSAKKRRIPFLYKIFYKFFYGILKSYSDLKIDEYAYNTRIISRRALNSILKLRENLRYMKPIYSIVGYNTSSLPLDKVMEWDSNEGFKERFKTSLVAITSFTSFLRAILLWIFMFSFLFMIGVTINALMVKFLGYDILGNPQQAESGWTFLVIMLSVFFAFTCLNLYIMSIYLSNIYTELKQRPPYIIESVKRF